MCAANSCPDPLPRLLTAGQLISVEPLSPDGRCLDTEGIYESQIQEVLLDSLLVRAPVQDHRCVIFPMNTGLVVFMNKYGIRYSFQTVVKGSNGVGGLYLSDVRGFQRNDRRQNVRVETLLEPMEFSVRGNSKMTSSVMFPVVVDLSVTGFGLTCLHPIHVGCVIHVGLDLPRVFGLVQADGMVLRVWGNEEGNAKGRAHMGVGFTNISHKDRDRVAGYILYQQQVLKKKGLI